VNKTGNTNVIHFVLKSITQFQLLVTSFTHLHTVLSHPAMCE